MMTREDLESYLIRMEVDFDEIEDCLWVVKSGDDGVPPVVVNYTPPVVLLRMKVMDLPQSGDDARLAASTAACWNSTRHGHRTRQLRHRGT
jgi:hypothetical protein